MRLSRLWSAFIAVLLLLPAACDEDSSAPPAPKAQASSPPPETEAIPLDQLSKKVVPQRYRLMLTIVPEKDRFEGDVEIDVTLTSPHNVIYLHGRDLTAEKIEAILPDSRHVSGTYEEVDPRGVVRLTFPETLPAAAATLHVVYSADFSRQTDALYKVADHDEFYAFSQFEPVAARMAFPAFDEPAFKTPFDLQIVARDQDKAVTNTPEVHAEPLGNGLTRHIFRTTKPLPTYLLAFAVGPLDIVEGPEIPASPLRPTPIPLRGVTVAGKGDQIRYALAQTPALVLTLENYFDVAYPFEKLDLIAAADFSGAMENAATIAYSEPLILMGENAPLAQRRDFALTHAHELSHQWFGDVVTPAWWDDLWLNESFANWMGAKAAAQTLPRDEYDRQAMREALDIMDLDAVSSARSIRQPIKSEDDIYSAFDGITYDKGAGVLAMFETYVGADAFREGVRAYMKRFPFGTATARDFLDSLAQGSSRPDVAKAFDTFLTQPGVPLVSMTTNCEANPTVALTQSAFAATPQSPPRLWQIPVCLRDATSGATANCNLLDQAAKSFPITGTCEAAAIPNAGGSGYYRFALTPKGWSDLTSRMADLTAGERLAVLHNLRAAFRGGQVETKLYLDTLAAAVKDDEWDVVDTALKFFKELHDTMFEPGERTDFDTRMTALLMPRYLQLGVEDVAGEAAGIALTRKSIVEFLAKWTSARRVMEDLTLKGEAVIGTSGKEIAGLSPDLEDVAMWTAGEKDGAATGRQMIEALGRSQDQEFRRSLLIALQSIDDPAFDLQRNSLALSETLQANEAVALIRGLMENADRRPATWTWLKEHFDELGKRLSDQSRGRLVRLVQNQCDATARADAAAFFEPKIAQLAGGDRFLANALDTADRCIALKTTRSAEVAAWFKGG